MAYLTRTDLHAALVDIAGEGNVYFEPPASVRLKFPCIIYNLSRLHTRSADNGPDYIKYDSYTVTLITQSPEQPRTESSLERLRSLRGSVFDRQFVSDNLHHYVYTVYLG